MRDLRDPQKLGEALLSSLKYNRFGSASKVYDELYQSWAVPLSPSHDTMGQRTAQAYRDELSQRAACGDRHAAAMLNSLTTGTALTPDPGGN